MRTTKAASVVLVMTTLAWSAADRTLLSLRLVPSETTIQGAQASQRFLVIGKYADGVERDLTSQARFSLSNPQVAKVDETGRVQSLVNGVVALRAEVANQQAKAAIRIEASQEKSPFSFEAEIVGIFTKRGCNDSNCHGAVKGRGGFKLSQNGLDPREDYHWIVEGGGYQVLTPEPLAPKTPRINAKEPEKSLLLLKPTLAVAHGGGERFKFNSSDYQTILNWIRNGAPYGDAFHIERVDVYPRETVLDTTGKQQLLVTAYLSGGRRRDITDAVYYTSNNPEVVKISSEGLMQAVRPGETVVLVRAVGHAISAGVGVIAKSIPNYPTVPRRNLIDEYIFAKLRKLQIAPSELSSDSEFLRRVCLDLTGALPPPSRVREFVASNDPRKRDKLIDILLNSPEYVDYWTFRFSDVFRVAASPTGNHTRSTDAYWEWIRSSIADNKPYDQVARERISAQGYDGPSRHYLPYEELAPVERLVAEEVRVFMGRRLDCAQCHNHPNENWTQNQFWGIAAFFGEMNFTAWSSVADQAIFEVAGGRDLNYGAVKQTSKVIHPRTKQEVEPTFLDGTVLPEAARVDPRMALAKWMTSHPYFAEAIVNRMWGFFFGRGIVDPVDDFRASNPPTHPELLNALAKDFREHGHDLKRLIGLIVQSRAYQLSSKSNESNKDDKMNYSHAAPRALEAEVLLDAISTVTGVPEVFEHETGGIAPYGTHAIDLREPDKYPSRFLEMYGRPLRHALPERDGQPNLGQALHMLVGSTYTNKLSKPAGRIHQLINNGASDREIIEQLYLAALARFPTAGERDELLTAIAAEAGQGSSRSRIFEHLLWAVISSREFSENH
jgi:hypothetical protein